MQELYKIKDGLIEAIIEMGEGGPLDRLDKLAHTAKNICKIIEYCENGSGSYGGSYNGSYDGTGSYYSREGGSYARGRGRARDSMGRYSRDSGELVRKMQELMKQAPNEDMRRSLQRITEEIEQM